MLFYGLFCTSAIGQTASTPNGNFEVNQVIGCAPFTVTPNNLLTGGGSIQYNFENTLDPSACSTNYQADPFSCSNGSYVSATSFTYANAGTYFLIQLNGNAPDGNKVSYIEITVVDPVQPQFDVYACSNNKVVLELNFAQDDYDSYIIDFGDGNTQTVNKNSGGANPNEVNYTYAVAGSYPIRVLGAVSGSTVNCSETTTNITTLDAGIQPIVNLVEVLDPSTISIKYETLDNRLAHQLTIRSANGSVHLDIGIDPNTNPSQITISDNALSLIDTVYEIYIKTTDRCNDIVIPPSESVYSVSTAYSAAYFGAVIELDFSFETNANGLSGVRFMEDGTPQETFTVSSGQVIRAISSCVNVGDYFYQAQFGNAVSISAPFTVDLNGTLTPFPIQNINGELDGATFKLEYEEAPIDVAFYSIYKKDQNGVFQLLGTSANTSYTDTDLKSGVLELCYAISYQDECGNESELSTEVCFELSSSNILLPNAFTPNGDGHNDTFKVLDGVFLEFQMLIFNRWGNILFSSTNPQTGWNGTFNGQPSDVGTYVYQISFRNGANTLVEQTGTFVLIR